MLERLLTLSRTMKMQIKKTYQEMEMETEVKAAQKVKMAMVMAMAMVMTTEMEMKMVMETRVRKNTRRTMENRRPGNTLFWCSMVTGMTAMMKATRWTMQVTLMKTIQTVLFWTRARS